MPGRDSGPLLITEVNIADIGPEKQDIGNDSHIIKYSDVQVNPLAHTPTDRQPASQQGLTQTLLTLADAAKYLHKLSRAVT
jgi:hypothetical protein